MPTLGPDKIPFLGPHGHTTANSMSSSCLFIPSFLTGPGRNGNVSRCINKAIVSVEGVTDILTFDGYIVCESRTDQLIYEEELPAFGQERSSGSANRG